MDMDGEVWPNPIPLFPFVTAEKTSDDGGISEAKQLALHTLLIPLLQTRRIVYDKAIPPHLAFSSFRSLRCFWICKIASPNSMCSGVIESMMKVCGTGSADGIVILSTTIRVKVSRAGILVGEVCLF